MIIHVASRPRLPLHCISHRLSGDTSALKNPVSPLSPLRVARMKKRRKVEKSKRRNVKKSPNADSSWILRHSKFAIPRYATGNGNHTGFLACSAISAGKFYVRSSDTSALHRVSRCGRLPGYGRAGLRGVAEMTTPAAGCIRSSEPVGCASGRGSPWLPWRGRGTPGSRRPRSRSVS